MPELGPEERELLERAATPLYESIVDQGGIDADDPRISGRGADRESFALLQRLGLLTEEPGTGRWVALDPSTVQSRVVSPLTQEGVRLLGESSSWANSFAPLAQAWRRAPDTSQGPFTVLHATAIDPFIAGLVAECEEEMLTAQPQTGRSADSLAAAAKRDVFLDDDPSPEAVAAQFAAWLDAARARGAAIAIGHPREATLALLERELPRARAAGFELVPVSYLLERSESLPE